MLDQMFTSENFRRIYDIENRKGLDLASRYFPTLETHTVNIRNKLQSIRRLRKIKDTLNIDDYNTRLNALKEEFTNLKNEKSLAIDLLMESISQKVLQPRYKINLCKKKDPKEKPVFCVDSEPETFFVVKQLQHNIKRIYDVKQANRHQLVCQIRDTLDNDFPCKVIRTDISSFYESIDRKRLVEKLDHDLLLNTESKKYIKQILNSYNKLSESTTGIPRGVGVSAYLAELYMRSVDKTIKAIPGLVLYCRFVDDIVAIFALPPPGNSYDKFEDIICKILEDNGFTQNPQKTLALLLPKNSGTVEKFEYLGYLFQMKRNHLDISPSEAKVNKYEARMNTAFAAYQKEVSVNSKCAFRKLVGRIKFLTGNTRLSNSKSYAATGIYFSNSIATEILVFKELDNKLKKHITETKRSKLQKQLRKFSFTNGFNERRYHNFTTRELQIIVKVWKHG